MPGAAWAHGFAGKRFFPTTLAVDDPFVSDELSFLANHIQGPEQETSELSVEFAKRITPRFGIEVGESYQRLESEDGKTHYGFGNLELGMKYQFFTSDPAELILAVGLDAELGDTGSDAVDAESFSVISPTFFFGKGFGDLPEPAKFLKPLAITGTLSPNFPTRESSVMTTLNPDSGSIEQDLERNPTTLSYGLTVQYNFQYLQSFVQDIGLKAPFNRMVPLVELALETCLDRGCEGQTTGTVNPGLIWFGKRMQLGIEAQIPINERTGEDAGVLFLAHFFLDDIFPQGLGRPIFSQER